MQELLYYIFFFIFQFYNYFVTKKEGPTPLRRTNDLMDLHKNELPIIPKQTSAYWSFLQTAQYSPAYTCKPSLQHLPILIQKLQIPDRRIWSLQFHSQKYPSSTRFLAAVSSSQLEHLLSLHLKSEPLVFCWLLRSTSSQKCRNAIMLNPPHLTINDPNTLKFNIHQDLLLGTSETKLARVTWRDWCSFRDDQQIAGRDYHSTTHLNSNKQLGFMIQQPTLPSSHSNAWIAQFHILPWLQSALITWHSRRRSGKFLRPAKSLPKSELVSSMHLINASTRIGSNLTSTAHFIKTPRLSLKLESSSPKFLHPPKSADLLIYVHNTIII